MFTIIVSTTADRTRPGLTFKIELGDEAYEQWSTSNTVVEAWRKAFASEPTWSSANTGLLIIHPDGHVEAKMYDFTWEGLTNALMDADAAGRNPYETSRGRPEKRVLVLTTSKERRTGALVARSSY